MFVPYLGKISSDVFFLRLGVNYDSVVALTADGTTAASGGDA